MKRRLVFAVCLLLGTEAVARVKISFEQNVAHRLAGSVSLSRPETNSGIWPTKWEQLDAFNVSYLNRALLERGLGTVQEMYVFTPTNLTMLRPRKGYVIMAYHQPVRENWTKGRCLIYNNPEFDPFGIGSTWVDETEFQKMLKQSGVTLPAPDLAEIRAAREALQIAYPDPPIVVAPIVFVVLFVIGVGFVVFRLRRRASVNSK